MHIRVYLILLISSLCFACGEELPQIEFPTLEVTKVTQFENGRFVNESGQLFIPWGFNYTNIEEFGLIEDGWNDTQTWTIVDKDMKDMKAMGANIVRIHLQFGRFMSSAEQINEDALSNLERYVQTIQDNGLYVIVTGLASYRKSDTPSWYNAMTDEQRWNSQMIFWQSVARRLKGFPAVFSYNLMNEPVVSVGCTEDNIDCDWLPGDGFGGYNFVQNITRLPNLNVLATMKSWIAEMTNAIRQEDPNTFITFGSLSLGNVNRFQEDIDYMSAHIYPKSDDLDKSIDYIISNATGPLIIEETANLNCSANELRDFINAIDGNYHGLLGHFHGHSIEELSSLSIVDGTRRKFFELFMNINPN